MAIKIKKRHWLNEDDELILRPSKIADVMASANKNELSAGAKTFLINAFKETYWGYEDGIEGEALSKGIAQEEDAIELVSKFYKEDYTKNEERRSNGFIRGTCDIFHEEFGLKKIRDVKCSWSKKSFPITKDQARNTKYEWQGRAYMWLWDADEFHLDYCLMPTPESLLKPWENKDLHNVDDLDISQRITSVSFLRNYEHEAQMINRITLLRQEWNSLKKQFKID
jgi:hypothetical protein